jgi:hypothetical protein
MKTLFKVKYSLRTTSLNNGEFEPDHKIEEHLLMSETNDLNEIFTDLFDTHRFDGIVGLVILGVEEQIHPRDLKNHYDIHYA